MLARLYVALCAALAPLLAVAQPAGGEAAAPTRAGYGWLWIVAAVAILVALFRIFFTGRREERHPPARGP